MFNDLTLFFSKFHNLNFVTIYIKPRWTLKKMLDSLALFAINCSLRFSSYNLSLVSNAVRSLYETYFVICCVTTMLHVCDRPFKDVIRKKFLKKVKQPR